MNKFLPPNNILVDPEILNNPMTSTNKEESCTYAGFHKRVYRQKGKANHCEKCDGSKAKKFEWANVSGHYEKIEDYIQLCVSCHKKMDNKGMWSFFKRKDKKCKMCKITFSPKSSSHVLCGSRTSKIGCAYKNFNNYHLKRYHGKKLLKKRS